MNSQLKNYLYFIVIAIATLSIMGLLQGSADAATDLPPCQVLFSSLCIYDGKSDKLQSNIHLFVADNKIDQVSIEPMKEASCYPWCACSQAEDTVRFWVNMTPTLAASRGMRFILANI